MLIQISIVTEIFILFIILVQNIIAEMKLKYPSANNSNKALRRAKGGIPRCSGLSQLCAITNRKRQADVRFDM